MYFLFSGEGPTDLGLCADDAPTCEGDQYEHGPMTVMVDQIVQRRHHYSLLETGHCGFVSRRTLVERARELKDAKKGLRLPGKKRAKETRYFFNNARVLARIATARQRELGEDVVAVLFRDSDSASAGRGVWDDKRKSMLDGFKEEGFIRGVPMIPKPKSEAWLLCALKNDPYQGCATLEDRSSSGESPHSLKRELEALHGRSPSREELAEMVTSRTIDIERIDMPSFSAFRSRLEKVI